MPPRGGWGGGGMVTAEIEHELVCCFLMSNFPVMYYLDYMLYARIALELAFCSDQNVRYYFAF